MPNGLIVVIVLILGLAGYVLGRKRAMASAGGSARGMHSLPSYYGYNVALTTMIPAFLVLVIWMLVQPMVIANAVSGDMAPVAAEDEASQSLVMSDVRRIAGGLDAAVTQGRLTDAGSRALDIESDDVRGLLADGGVALGADVTAENLRAAQQSIFTKRPNFSPACAGTPAFRGAVAGQSWVFCHCYGARFTSLSSRWSWRCLWACSRRSICLNMPRAPCVRSPSRC